jgi:hypothetical protein
VVHVASPQRLREDEVEGRWVDVTGCIGPFYPFFHLWAASVEWSIVLAPWSKRVSHVLRGRVPGLVVVRC